MEENTRNGQIIHYDKDGNEYCLDENGNHIKPLLAPIDSWTSESGFTVCNAPGYCPLCGWLGCNGGCFKG